MATRENQQTGAEQQHSQLHAWVDESMHAATEHSPGMYLLAATYGDPAGCEATRGALRELLLGKAQRLHWRDESAARQRKIAAAVAACEVLCTVVIATPLDPKKQERARRKCMERLFFELQGVGVGRIFLENRTTSLNAHDQRMVASMRGSGTLRPHVRVEFALPSVEPMLWVPDAVAGAVGMARKGTDPSHVVTLGSALEQIDISI